MHALESEMDWEVTAEGLYVATRRFLVRRGYCCGNRCKNCPYVNWRTSPAWIPTEVKNVRRTRVSPKVLLGLHTILHHYQEQSQHPSNDDHDYHQRMITHHQSLLTLWDQPR